MGFENNIPDGWMETTLGEVALIGSSKRIFFSEYVDKGIPFYRSKEIIQKQKGNNISTELFITDKKYDNLKKNFGAPKENDILLTSVGTLGIPYRVKKNEIFYFKDGNLTWFRDYQNIESAFLYNWFLSSTGKHELNKITIGSTQSALTISGLKSIEILLPPIKEQISITNIINSFDDKIELLQAQNKTLETIAKTIFKEWFGKYQIGDELPEGWRVGEFGELFNLTMGLSPKGDSYNHDMIGVPLLNGAGDYTGEKLDPKRYTSKPTRINKVGDLVFCIRGTIGKIVFAEKEYCLGRGVAALSPKESNDKYFNYIKLKRIIDELTRNATGSVILGLSKDDIKKAELILPSRKKLDEFSKVVKPLFNKIEINNNQLQSLTKTRDSLLPKLMSGQVRVNNIKQTADA